MVRESSSAVVASLFTVGLMAGAFPAAKTGSLLSQTTPAIASGPAFEVASVKTNRSGELGAQLRPAPDGSLVAVNEPLPALLEFAFGYPANRILGLPRWAFEERFDVNARGNGEPTTSIDQIARMLRALLIERFLLKVRTEVRQVPVYLLQLERADRQFGPMLSVSTRADCLAMARGDREAIKQQPDPTGAPCGIGNAMGLIRARGVPIVRLGEALGRVVDRPIVDQTGLGGLFDFDLSFRADGAPFPIPVPVVPADSTAPAVFTAVREQLGLRLLPGRDDVEVLVVYAVEGPTLD